MSTLKTVTITNNKGLELTILNYGATIQSLKIPTKQGKKINVVVGLKKPEDYISSPYINHPTFLGCSIGRYAGRISKRKFNIYENEFPIYHENGIHLHGGKKGFDAQYWTFENITPDNSSVTLSYHSKHLQEGYPGNLNVSVTYSLIGAGVEILYKAITDKTTIVNLTNHAYFNLDGENTILNHDLQINSSHYLEVDNQLLPSGNLIPSKNTRFDFNELSPIKNNNFIGFDDTFVLNGNETAAILRSKKTGIQMTIETNQPAIVVYTKKKFPELPLSNNYDEYPSICFETQNFPDAPNKKHFPSSLLKVGEVYKNKTFLNFSLLS